MPTTDPTPRLRRDSRLCPQRGLTGFTSMCTLVDSSMQIARPQSTTVRERIIYYNKERKIKSVAKVLIHALEFEWPQVNDWTVVLLTSSLRLLHQIPDELFHNFRASKSVDRRIYCSAGASCD